MLPEYVKFYYDNLPYEMKQIYLQMYTAFREKNRVVNIICDNSKISIDDIAYIFRCLYNDTPSFYYVHPTRWKWRTTPNGYYFEKEFLYSIKQIGEYDRRLMQGMKAFRSKYMHPSMTDYQKEFAIYNYLIKTITYDYDTVTGKTPGHDEIYNILGALLRRKAVCWGIACAFKLLCDYCKLKCFVVIGEPLNNTSNSGHAWNMIKIENETYHVDATWDLRVKGNITRCYDYLNLDDHLIRMNHTWDDQIYPICNHLEYNYYRKNRLYVRKPEQISGYIAKQLSAGETYIAFKFANRLPPADIIREQILKGFVQAGCTSRYYYLIREDTHNIYVEIPSDR